MKFQSWKNAAKIERQKSSFLIPEQPQKSGLHAFPLITIIFLYFCHSPLVRMRSAVRIRPAAPKSPVFYRKQDFFFAFLTDLICGSVCGSKLAHTLGAVCALADVALAVGAFLSYIESTPFLVATTHTTTPRRKLLLFRALEFNSTLLFTGGSSNT